MSFNTSWGSSTRQDHPTFMSGTQPSNSGRSRDTTSFSKQNNSSNTATISYAIGPSATTSPTRSPKKLTSTRLGLNASTSFTSSRANSSFVGEISFPSEEAVERHLRLSQKHEARIERIQEPDEKAPKDTTVNIASAFHQATTGTILPPTASMNGKPISSGSSRTLLRGPSSDRLAAPVLPSSRFRPPTSTQEEDISEGASARFKRAVSPIIEGAGQVVNAGIRAVSPGLATASQALITGASTLVGPSSFALREPRQSQYQSFRVPEEEESYDYAQEEALADALPSSQTNGKGLTKRKSIGKRVNEDNRAYRPPPEGHESESSDDDTKTRKKGIVVQRSLLTGAPAPGKKRTKRKSTGTVAPSEDGSTIVQRAGSNQSRAGSTLLAPSRQGSIQPPQFTSEDIEDVEEVEEEVGAVDPDDTVLQEPPFVDDGVDSFEEPSETPAPTIGARLGKATNVLIHLIVRSVGVVLLIVWNTLRSMYELLVERPKAFVAGGWREVKYLSDLVNIKSLAAIILIGAVWYSAFSGPSASPSPIPSRRGWFDFLPSFRRRPVYVAPEMPVGSVEELIERLHILEGAFVTLQAEHKSSVEEYRKGIQQLESDSRQSDGTLSGRLMGIENRLEGESRRAMAAEEADRQANRKSVKTLEDLISSVRNEVSALHVAVAQQSKNERTVDPRADEKIGALEKEMRDVYERLKAIAANDKKGQDRVISVDGKDIAKVVQDIISKDGVAMADYALYYSGGAIEPRTTSKTLSIRPGSWVGKDVHGRPPVTALVPDNSVGNCWPFAGSKAQLGVRLSRVVHLTHVTIDHPARELLIDPESAPRKFHLWVAIEGQDNIQRADIFSSQQEEGRRRSSASELPPKPFGPWNLLHVGTFEYNIQDSATAQTFELSAEYRALGIDTGAIVVDFGSNWGADHTCVYRIRAHGARTGPS